MRYKELLLVLALVATASWLWAKPASELSLDQAPPTPETSATRQPLEPSSPNAEERLQLAVTPGRTFAQTVFEVTYLPPASEAFREMQDDEKLSGRMYRKRVAFPQSPKSITLSRLDVPGERWSLPVQPAKFVKSVTDEPGRRWSFRGEELEALESPADSAEFTGQLSFQVDIVFEGERNEQLTSPAITFEPL